MSKLLTVIFVAFSITLPAQDCTKLKQDCDLAVTKLQELNKEQDNMIMVLTKQRNDAINQVGEKSLVPWYVWVVVGAAGATAAIGIRR